MLHTSQIFPQISVVSIKPEGNSVQTEVWQTCSVGLSGDTEITPQSHLVLGKGHGATPGRCQESPQSHHYFHLCQPGSNFSEAPKLPHQGLAQLQEQAEVWGLTGSGTQALAGSG